MRLLRYDNTGAISFTKDIPDSQLSAYEYAILSHTWGEDEEEVTYDDVVNGVGTSKPGVGSEKIRFCIQQARQDGLDFFWLDTCCINKKNDAELSRSLRSMFRWYANSKRCYVYLSDVPRGDELGEDWEQDFQYSRWYKRGWTLQELIAPSALEFYSKHGKNLGTKASLERQISDITRIPVKALRGKDLADFTTHERRQWQAGRETREPEDLVYSLLGLLNVSMPVLYGEGRVMAEQRLDDQISIAEKGPRYRDFSLTFSLADAALETQHFVGRESELQEIRTNLSSDGTRRTVVLHGLGGIGKTQIAVRYALKHRDNYSAFLWINAKDEDSVRLSYAEIAKRIFREHPTVAGLNNVDTSVNLDGTVEAVKTWLSSPMNTRWLMVCDNYDNPKLPEEVDPTAFDIRHFLPEAYQGCVIITTRSSQVKIGLSMRIDKLQSVQDSLKILENSCDRGVLADDHDAMQLAARLDGLPLALATAGAYLSQTPAVTLKEYLDYLETSWAKLQKLSPRLMTYEDRTLYSTWQVSFDQIERRDIRSANLLRLWAYLDNEDVWFELLNDGVTQRPQWLKDLTKDKLEFYASIQVLCDHGLVQPATENVIICESKGYSIHACVHSWTQAVLNPEWNPDLATAALDCVASHVPGADEKSHTLLQRRLLKHALKSSRHVGRFHNVGQLADPLGILYLYQHKYEDAIQMLQYAAEAFSVTLGVEHPATLMTMNNLAMAYVHQGRLEVAEVLQLEVVNTKETVLGLENAGTLTSMDNLAAIYDGQGKRQEAKELRLKVVEAMKRVLGLEHPDTLKSMDNLATTYRGQRQWREAEELQVTVVKTIEAVLGPDHPSTLTSIGNLASLYKELERWQEAGELRARALKVKMRLFGSEDASTLETMADLAEAYRGQERLEEAEALEVKVMETRKRVLGMTHPSTLTAMANLASTYTRQKRWNEAEELGMEAVKMCKIVLGSEHNLTLTSMNNLAATYMQQGQLEEAAKLEKEVVEARRRVLGHEDAMTLRGMSNLAWLYIISNRLSEAEELEVEVLEKSKRVLGPDDPATLKSMNTLAVLYYSLDKTQEAQNLMTLCVEARTRVLGATHEDTQDSLSCLELMRSEIEQMNID